MSISIAQPLGQIWVEDDFDAMILQSSLKEFVYQFQLEGACLFQFCFQQKAVYRLGYWSELPIASTLPGLESLTDWMRVTTAPLFETVLIGTTSIETVSIETVLIDQSYSTSYQVYGCLCHRTPQAFWYLLCWQQSALTEHQRYGISVYAKALNQQLPKLPAQNPHLLHEMLQCTRHQLRTPLSLILLYVDLLKQTTADHRSQEWLDNLKTTAEEMNISLDHLMDQTALVDRAYGNYDLRQLLEQCCQSMKPWIEQKQLKLVYDSQPLWLRVDEWKMKQVFQNLLSNAIAFSPIAGQVTCEWQTFQTEVLIKISDHGPGLSAEDLRSLGTPFYSRRPGGTGLGLSIAKQIILEHQGSLWADNLPDGGAQFCIMLPRNLSP